MPEYTTIATGPLTSKLTFMPTIGLRGTERPPDGTPLARRPRAVPERHGERESCAESNPGAGGRRAGSARLRDSSPAKSRKLDSTRGLARPEGRGRPGVGYDRPFAPSGD